MASASSTHTDCWRNRSCPARPALGGGSELAVGMTDQHRPRAQQELDVPLPLRPTPARRGLRGSDVAGECKSARGENAPRLCRLTPARYPAPDPAHGLPLASRHTSGTMWPLEGRKMSFRFSRRRAVGRTRSAIHCRAVVQSRPRRFASTWTINNSGVYAKLEIHRE